MSDAENTSEQTASSPNSTVTLLRNKRRSYNFHFYTKKSKNTIVNLDVLITSAQSVSLISEVTFVSSGSVIFFFGQMYPKVEHNVVGMYTATKWWNRSTPVLQLC